ncbi:MAG: hypothetical protein AAFR59_06215, partial [Bacteroidota bacterium]
EGTTGTTDNNNRPGYEIQNYIDLETNETVQIVRETGTIQPVKAKNPPNIYYAYHKTLPKGTKIRLEVPGASGKYKWVELTVIDRLRSDNPNVVGLGKEVIQKVFKESQAKNVAAATILYPLP